MRRFLVWKHAASWFGKVLRRHVTTFCLITLVANYGTAQWSQFSQPELRDITEHLIRNQRIAVAPPWVQRLWIAPGQVRLGICKGDFPRELTDDPLFNRALNAQLQVSLIRIYRNQPAMVRNWRSTLASVEQQIVEMLKVVSSNALTDQQKHLLLGNSESRVRAIYDDFFLRWAQAERRFDWGEYGIQINLHTVFLNKSEVGTVSYLCAGPWEIYQYAKKKGKVVPVPKWLIETSDRLFLAGEYYFCATFAKSQSDVIGPIDINEDKSILFQPNQRP